MPENAGHKRVYRIALIALCAVLAAFLFLFIAANAFLKGDFIAGHLSNRLDRDFDIEGTMNIDIVR